MATVAVTEDRISICGWPTDVLSIDHIVSQNGPNPHTLLLFIPGNPGVIHWYVDFLLRIVQHLGDGYAVRGVSYAGHGVGDDVVGTDSDHDNNCSDKMGTAWTMDGQGKNVGIGSCDPASKLKTSFHTSST
jgi:hypothetical protein